MTLPNLLLFSLGVLAIAAPLWVHLRLGRVKKRVTVSSLRLMRASPQTSKSPRRLVDVPLLLLRSLIVLLIALGFGRLLIPGMKGGGVQQYAVFVVDGSGSMQAVDGSTVVWSEARDKVLAAMKALGPGSRVALVRSPLGPETPAWETPAQAMERVKALKPGFAANRLAASIREGEKLLAAMPDDRPKVLHLVSDFQRSSLVDLDSLSVPTGIELQVSKVGPLRSANRGVSVQVAAAGATDLGIYSFSDGSGGTLRMDEKGQVTQLPVVAGQGGVRLGHTGKKGEWTIRKLDFEEADALAADNVAYDVYQAQDTLPVWLWEPTGELQVSAAPAPLPASRIIARGARPTPAAAAVKSGPQHAYEQSSYFISRALQPASEDEAAAVSRYRPIVLTTANLASALEEAATAMTPRLLVLPATKEVPAELAALARRVVESGGAVIFFGGPELEPAVYQQRFGDLLPVTVAAPEECKLAPALAEITADNPLWGGLDSFSRRQLEKSPLKVRHALQPVPQATVLAHYADRAPFVVERILGGGRSYFVNTSGDRAWGDWAASAPLFVPAMHLLAARALGDDAFAAAHAPVSPGEAVVLKLAPELAGKSLKVGEATYPIARDGRVTGVVFERPGVAELNLTDGTEAGRIAVNFPASESLLESEPEAVIRQRIESLRRPGGDSAVRWEKEEQGGLAWRICLLLAALLLVIEPIVANHRLKP